MFILEKRGLSPIILFSEIRLSFPISAPTVNVNPTGYGFSINKEQ